MLLNFADQGSRVASYIPEGNDIDDVAVDAIDDFVEAVP